MDQNRRTLAMQLVAAAVAVGGVGTAHAGDPKEKRNVPPVIKDWMGPWMAGGLSTDHGLDKFYATLSSDSTYTDPNFPTPVLMLSLKEHWKDEFGAWPDAKFESAGLDAISDNAWVWRWVMHGTHTGTNKALTIAPTGRSFTVPGCDFIELRGDKISRDVGYFDRFTLLSQLGFTLNNPPAPAR
jgi:predicted ester cyclase